MEPSPRFAGCPASPNCVSSRAPDQDRRVSPMPVEVGLDEAWDKLKRVLATEPRLRVVEECKDQGYLRAEATSRVFGFVDDVEFQFQPAEKLLHVRSASRVGYWDLGVNRRRVERLREALRREGLWR